MMPLVLMLGGGGALFYSCWQEQPSVGISIFDRSSAYSTASLSPRCQRQLQPVHRPFQLQSPDAGSQSLTPVAVHQAPGLPPAAGPSGGTIPTAVLQQIKEATVFVKVEAGRDSGSGSGFVMLTEGETAYVATNHHVVTPEPEEVVIRRGRIYRVGRSTAGHSSGQFGIQQRHAAQAHCPL